MGYIRQLPEDLIKKIAAGEVIERPASVVKELVENSIDAGATKIEIEIERAGKYIKVSDNGMGIDPDDIDLLFARHATSKIKNFDDLWRMDSLGFRGEALSSIGAVSKINCKSKHINQEYGFEINVANGKFNRKSSAISIGTIFEVSDLFYNVPARQKFLKSGKAELGHIYDVVVSEAISHPKIAIKLLNDKNIVRETSGSKDLQQVIFELLGNDLKDKLISISGKNHFLSISGYLSELEVYRSDRKSTFIFINNRPVKCQIISKAITSGFEGLLPAAKYPVIILNLYFEPKFVDVNVHPAKKEVRYTHPNDVYNIVLHSIQNAVSNHYKEKYKEKSVYSMPEVRDLGFEIQTSNLVPRASYSDAAFDFYAPTDRDENSELTPEGIESSALSLFSVSNLKCNVIYSKKPIANMTKIGSKTIFEVGSIYEGDVQIVFSGEIVGDQNYQKDFFNCLSELSKDVFDNYLKDKFVIQKKLVSPNLEDIEANDKHRKKPPEKLLYEVWERDNWTCVYCGKKLLDPKVVKEAMPHAKDAFVTYMNNEGKKITNHILREHTASYDHYLPVSKLPQFSFELENLFACCFECNRKKLDSMELKAWKPKGQNGWTTSLDLAGLSFNSPKTFVKAANLRA